MSTRRWISPDTKILTLSDGILLESGIHLAPVQVAYRTWGTLNSHKDNAVLVCHALTGTADVDSWWSGLLGSGHALDPDHDFVICSNVLGSCYGTTGPASPKPGSDQPYGPDFPDITVRDMVHLQARLLDALGVERLQLVIGGSLGGMQVLEWAACYPERVDTIAPIATCGRHSAWCIGLSEAQRAAIRADVRWCGGRYQPDNPPQDGLAVARMIAMCTYRCSESFEQRFGRQVAASGTYQVESYLAHHGNKLVDRFDANSYLTLTLAMDRHDLGRDRPGYARVLRSIRQPSLVVSIDSDVLYPPRDQGELVDGMRNAQLGWLRSTHGHDGFLIEIGALDRLIQEFRRGLHSYCQRKAS